MPAPQPNQSPHQQGPLDPNAATTQFDQSGPGMPTGSSAPRPKKKRPALKWGGGILGTAIVLSVFANMGGGAEEETTAAVSSSTITTAQSAPAPQSTDADTSQDTEVAPSPSPTQADVTAHLTDAEVTNAKDAVDDADNGVPAEYRSALREAKSYDRVMNMSKVGLHDQLTSEYGGQFTAEAAQYAVDNLGADWNTNALASARSYQDNMDMSPAAIHDQLTSEYGGQFTAAEADYALANLNGGAETGTDAGSDSGVAAEFTAALGQAESYADTMNMSRQGVYDQLASEYGGQFSAAAAQYAIDNIQADWNANALASARSYQDNMDMSPAAIHDQLTSEYGGQFTAAEADYAIANL